MKNVGSNGIRREIFEGNSAAGEWTQKEYFARTNYYQVLAWFGKAGSMERLGSASEGNSPVQPRRPALRADVDENHENQSPKSGPVKSKPTPTFSATNISVHHTTCLTFCSGFHRRLTIVNFRGSSPP